MKPKSKIHFEISERKILLRIFDIVFVLISLYAVSSIFNFGYFMISADNWAWSIVLAIYLTVFATIFELYSLQKTNDRSRVFKNIILTTSVTVLFYLLTPFYTPSLPENRLQIIYFFLAILGALCVWRIAYITLIVSPRFYKNVLVVGDSFEIDKIAENLQAADPHYVVVGYLNTLEDNSSDQIPKVKLSHLLQMVKKMRVSEIVVSSSLEEGVVKELYVKLLVLLKEGYPIKEYFNVYEELTHRLPVENLQKDFYKYFPFSRSNQNKLYLFFHRMFDLVFSCIGLLFLLILSPFVLLMNLGWNRGPLFYKQTRVGKAGKNFEIVKFRTMVTNAEKLGAQFATKDDARITAFGKFLRKTRIDEIPQFLNVLNGEMSFIGPRPERPFFVEELSQSIAFYEIRHAIKPGLTGWAQVSVKYGESAEDSLTKLQYDLYYIKHRGMFLDLRIILKTMSTVIFFRGQ
ncbi:sugar transferase [Mesonia ostreae]|uniref:Sugar transferase n=1 Tax=Mesonia ostreae TaxID=861110 RepID=A0ABU2KM19_9FLAO|nr:sugar transferase [Mesonia ostreae]MDT0295724.1 sugar transferase [Mesonia ostreae]